LRGLGVLSRCYDGAIKTVMLDNDDADSDDADPLDDDVSDVSEEGALALCSRVTATSSGEEAALSGLLPGYGQRLLRLHPGRKERASQKKSEKEAKNNKNILLSFYKILNNRCT
jgi:hypothetical protein